MVSEEAKIVGRRLNVQLSTKISLLQMAASSIPNMNVQPKATKKVAADLRKLLKELSDGI